MFVPGSVLKKLRKEAFAQMDQTKILKYRRTYGDPVKENDVASSQEQEDSKIQIAVSMENLEYLDIVTEDREVMKIYLSWMELKQQEDPQSILNKDCRKTVLSDASTDCKKTSDGRIKGKERSYIYK